MRDVVHDRALVTDQVVEEYYRPLRRKGAWAAQLRLERASGPAWVEEHLDRIAAPTLLIWGEEDPWHPLAMAEEFRRRLPSTRLRVIPGCGHVPHEERPDEFNAAALPFLAEDHA